MLHVSLVSKIIELYALWIKYELIPYSFLTLCNYYKELPARGEQVEGEW